MDDTHPHDDQDAQATARMLGVAQRRLVLALTDGWTAADDDRTAKRMLLGVRDSRGLIERRTKSENLWRLTDMGRRVQAVLTAGG